MEYGDPDQGTRKGCPYNDTVGHCAVIVGAGVGLGGVGTLAVALEQVPAMSAIV